MDVLAHPQLATVQVEVAANAPPGTPSAEGHRASRRAQAAHMDDPVGPRSASSPLWPTVATTLSGPDDLTGFYRTRADIPPAMVQSLLAGAAANVDILAFAATWLWDGVPGFVHTLANRAGAGGSIRVCTATLRAKQSGSEARKSGSGKAWLPAAALRSPMRNESRLVAPGTVRRSGAPLYASILRFDDDVLLNTHLWGRQLMTPRSSASVGRTPAVWPPTSSRRLIESGTRLRSSDRPARSPRHHKPAPRPQVPTHRWTGP